MICLVPLVFPLALMTIPAAGDVPDAADAPALFAQHCASCHGADGDGDGTAPLDRRARSFREGGFSFGNTSLAIGRVLEFGIPGTPMPSFSGALSAEERAALAEFVRSLGPPIEEASVDKTELIVGERPVFVRGKLPPLFEGDDVRPRGVGLGLPDGLCFFWAVTQDDVQLVAVNAGRFVRRTDWGGRGGSELELIGRRVWTRQAASSQDFEFFTGEGLRPLAKRFRGTWIREGGAGIRYDLVGEDGVIAGRVEERCSAFTIPSAYGLERAAAVTWGPEQPMPLCKPAESIASRLAAVTDEGVATEHTLSLDGSELETEGRIRWTRRSLFEVAAADAEAALKELWRGW